MQSYGLPSFLANSAFGTGPGMGPGAGDIMCASLRDGASPMEAGLADR